MNLRDRFVFLDYLLTRTRRYWQCVAFEHDDLPWPELSEALNGIEDEQLHVLDGDAARMHALFAPVIPELLELAELLCLPAIKTSYDEYPFWLSNGIKGRKLEQLKAFVSGVYNPDLPVLEWCAGKGHLGRMLAFKGVPAVHSIELQSGLCEQGQQSAERQGLQMQFTQADVLQSEAGRHVLQHQHAIALHACGGLHQSLMRSAVAKQTASLSISPCCYHLFGEGEPYQPMSEFVRARSELVFSASDLKLALQETVTAKDRITRVRQKEVTWRLGFDSLRRQVTGVREYVGVPSVGKAIFSGEFADFCRWAADKKGISLPDEVNFDAFLAHGERRKRVTDRIELIRHLFRRAIEVWLVLDRALYLEQHGYQVTLHTFCERQLTPRNILISANFIDDIDKET